MIKRLIKEIFMCLASVIIIGLFGTAAKAAGENVPSTDQENWIDETAFYCLRAGGQDMEKEYYLSQAYFIQQDSECNRKIYFVFCEGKCVGELLVNDQMQSCAFFQMNCEDVTWFYANNIDILIFSTDEDHIYATGKDIGYVSCLYGICEENIEFKDETECALTIVIHPINVDCTSGSGDDRSVIDESYCLNVPKHGNPQAPDTGYGMCWVSCVLSIMDYVLGTTGYTPMTLYAYLESVYPPTAYQFGVYPPTVYGYPSGTETWITRLFTILGYSPTHAETGLTFNTVKSVINLGKPIYAGLHNSTSGHAVVICGYSLFSQAGVTFYYYYTLQDPNVPVGYVTVSVPGSGTNFTYGSYTTWTRYYY